MEDYHLGAGDKFMAVPNIAGLKVLLPIFGYSLAEL